MEFKKGDRVRRAHQTGRMKEVDDTVGIVLKGEDYNGDVHVDWPTVGVELSRPEELGLVSRPV